MPDIKIAAEQAIKDFLSQKFPSGSSPKPDQIKAALVEFGETKPIDAHIEVRRGDDPNVIVVTLPAHLAELLREKL